MAPSEYDGKANVTKAISKIKRFYDAGFNDGFIYGILCGSIFSISITGVYMYIRFYKMLPTAIKNMEMRNLTKEPMMHLKNVYNTVKAAYSNL
jgi:hypothetical protein